MDGDEDIYPSVDNNKGFKARGLPNIHRSLEGQSPIITQHNLSKLGKSLVNNSLENNG